MKFEYHLRLVVGVLMAWAFGGNAQQTISYSYDPRGRLTRMKTSAGMAISYRYDEAGNLVFLRLVSDADGDGMDDGWEIWHWGDTSTADSSSDADGDGFFDWKEFIADTDPTNIASLLVVLADPASGQAKDSESTNSFVIRWPSRPYRTYSIERATNLVHGGFRTVAVGIPSTPPENVYTDQIDNAQSRYFYRIRIERDE